MCTGIGWDYRCRSCRTVISKDVNVSGHTCHEAKRAGTRGCCRTGIEFMFFNKVIDELCLLCEIKGEVEKVDALTCEEGKGEERVGYCFASDEDGYEEIQEYTAEQLKEWDEWKEEITSDEEDDEEEYETDCFSGTTYSVTTSMSERDEKTDIDDDDDDNDEDGGARLRQEEARIKAELENHPAYLGEETTSSLGAGWLTPFEKKDLGYLEQALRMHLGQSRRTDLMALID
ncbi:uncharacterized protein GGS22DRAFT_183613 [Annulohypoxylon maeteangense]|uniref:uncharacterized protein n=1 Tax=Annulohypoxylon maeteangense TaxID=1927788 RepID=UPI002008E9D5|nr:uncharacterized protein GGS22DRAFT_183613 [Annulohypoxylon maeteangense]KAI0890267.1 hypothetical protein GGS22DRAFT_183613 [Annulohypoxylon maeteangense]